MSCCGDNDPIRAHFGFGRDGRIGGNFLKKAQRQIRAEVHRTGRKIDDEVDRVGDTIDRQVRRTGHQFDEQLNRTGTQWEKFSLDMDVGYWLYNDFRRNPQNYVAIGTVLAYFVPWLGLPLAAGAAMRVARLESKKARAGVLVSDDPGEDGDDDGGGIPGGMLDDLNRLGLALLEWVKANPLLAAAVAFGAWELLKKVKR